MGQSPGHQLAPCKQNLFIADSPGPGPGPGGVTRKTRHTGPRVTATQSLLSNGTSLCVSPAPGSRDFEGTRPNTGLVPITGGGSDLQLHRSRSRTVGAYSGVHPIICVIVSTMSKSHKLHFIKTKNIDKTSCLQDTAIVGVCDREGH